MGRTLYPIRFSSSFSSSQLTRAKAHETLPVIVPYGKGLRGSICWP